MEKEFVPYELAVKLKALGFDEPCFGYYEPNKEFNYLNWEIFKDLPYLAKNSEWQDLCGAPTYSQVFRWFREVCGIWVTFEYDDCDCVEADICWYVGKCFRYGIGPLFLTNELGDFKTLQEAELTCLEKLIEIVEDEKTL